MGGPGGAGHDGGEAFTKRHTDTGTQNKDMYLYFKSEWDKNAVTWKGKRKTNPSIKGES